MSRRNRHARSDSTPEYGRAASDGQTPGPDHEPSSPGQLPSIQGAGSQAARQTLPSNANVLGMMPWSFLPRRSYQQMDLTTLSPGSFSAQQLLELLADAWPEASLALWNFQRLAASGWKYQVRTPDNADEDAEAQAVLDEIVGRINRDWGGFTSLINQWVMSVILQGACAGETIPDLDVEDVLDVVAVQPWTIFFQRARDQSYLVFQWQPMIAASGGGQASAQSALDLAFDAGSKAPTPFALLLQSALNHGGFRLLNPATFGYVPLDPDVDDPYGRTPFAPVLQLVVWDAQLIKDLRQWSHVNAYGRLDVSVVAAMVEEMMPASVKGNKAERLEWYTKYLSSLAEMYNAINPDDAMVHYDNVKIAGVSAQASTFQIDALIRVLERRIFRALKQLPILMGSNEGTTETWGTLQMEVYALGIANIQRVVASLATKLLESALRIRGHNARVVFEFETLRASDRLKEAQADREEANLAAFKRDQGWITQDEASILVTGSEAVAPGPNPDPAIAPDMPDQGGNPNASEELAEADDASKDEAGSGDSEDAGDSGGDKPKDGQESKDGEQDGEKKAGKAGTRAPKGARLRRRTPGDTGVEAEAVAPGIPVPDRAAPSTLVPSMQVRSDPKPRSITAARRWLEERLKIELMGYFLTHQPRRATVEHALESHRTSAIANWRGTWPTTADAVRKVVATRVARIEGRDTEDGLDLTPEEREALIASIMKVLEADIPDDERELYDTLHDFHVDAWNLGGQEALVFAGLTGTFLLTNAALLARIQKTATKRTAGIQTTTRRKVASAIVQGLESGADADAVWKNVRATFDAMLDYRPAQIATYEVPDGYYSASQETWRRNGISHKVWVTSSSPDPGAEPGDPTPCRDNSYAGAIPIRSKFPSGHYAPPAHSFCLCDVQPSGDPADAAYTEPWTGGESGGV
jgi:hypothetical protein